MPFAGAQPVLLERLVEHPLDPAVDASDPVDDPLDPEVEHRQLVPDLLQPPVYVVLLWCLSHVEIFHAESFDVKYFELISFDLEILDGRESRMELLHTELERAFAAEHARPRARAPQPAPPGEARAEPSPSFTSLSASSLSSRRTAR